MAKETLASVAKNFLLLLPPGEYLHDEIVTKFIMILQIYDLECLDPANRLHMVISRLRKSGILTLETIRKGNGFVYKKS